MATEAKIRQVPGLGELSLVSSLPRWMRPAWLQPQGGSSEDQAKGMVVGPEPWLVGDTNDNMAAIQTGSCQILMLWSIPHARR